MHFVVIWRPSGAAGDPDAESRLNELYRARINGTAWSEPIVGVMVLRVPTPDEYRQMVLTLQELASKTETEIPHHLLITPPMEEGTLYQGWLPRSEWDQLNRRTGVPTVDESRPAEVEAAS